MRYGHMPLLSWKPEYSVNEAELDSHHQKLFYLLNTAYENVMNSPEVDCVLPIIDELSKYIRYHLSAEEQYMRINEFHEIDAHIAKHREFTHTIEKLKTNYHGNNLEATQELIIVLGNWLLSHVITEDRKYSKLSTVNMERVSVSSISS
jgi:hemerythrin-like metal-binding protein